jgi:hypothetical protein
VYDFGTFLEHDASRRERLLGLNVLGTTEVLYAAMALNNRLKVENKEDFTFVLISSFQGLDARGWRPIYAPSKAYGIDLCASLFDGQEVAKCICAVPAPIDTPMLHRNHWVNKAHGSEGFFTKILDGSRVIYRSIFVDCNEETLKKIAQEEPAVDSADLINVMTSYKAARLAAFSSNIGLLTPEACAGTLVDTLASTQSSSGVYLLTPSDSSTRAAVEAAPFSELKRELSYVEAPWQRTNEP